MDSGGDIIGTLFTFFTFVLIIVLPMAMAYLQARKDRKTGYIHEKPAGTQPAEKDRTEYSSDNRAESDGYSYDRKPSKAKRRPLRTAAKSAGGLFSSIDLLRQQERESEPEVSFSEGPPSSTHQQQQTSQQLGEKFNPIEAMSNEFEIPLSKRTEAPEISEGGVYHASLPGTPAISKLRELNELQRAILLSEILGPPKGLE